MTCAAVAAALFVVLPLCSRLPFLASADHRFAAEVSPFRYPTLLTPFYPFGLMNHPPPPLPFQTGEYYVGVFGGCCDMASPVGFNFVWSMAGNLSLGDSCPFDRACASGICLTSGPFL